MIANVKLEITSNSNCMICATLVQVHGISLVLICVRKTSENYVSINLTRMIFRTLSSYLFVSKLYFMYYTISTTHTNASYFNRCKR